MASSCSPSSPGIPQLGLNNWIFLRSYLIVFTWSGQNLDIGMFQNTPGDTNEQPEWRAPAAIRPSHCSLTTLSKTQICCHPQEEGSQPLPLGYQLLHHPTPSSPRAPSALTLPYTSHWLRASSSKQATSFDFQSQTLPFAWNA